MSILKTIPALTINITQNNLGIGRDIDVNGTVKTMSAIKSELAVPNTNTSGIILISDKSGKILKGTDKFLVQQVADHFEEKVQVSETLAEDSPAMFMFGSKTAPCTFVLKMFDCASESQGGVRGEWYKGFQSLWETDLRASALFKADNVAIMVINNEAIFGYPMSMTLSKNSQEEFVGSINLNWLVLDRQTLINTDTLAAYMNFGDSNKLIDARKLPYALGLLEVLNKFAVFADNDAKGMGLVPIPTSGPIPYTSYTKDSFGKMLPRRMFEAKLSFSDNGTSVPFIKFVDGNYELADQLKPGGKYSLDSMRTFLGELVGMGDMTEEGKAAILSSNQLNGLYSLKDQWDYTESPVSALTTILVNSIESLKRRTLTQ